MNEIKLLSDQVKECIVNYIKSFEKYEVFIPESGLLAGYHKPIWVPEVSQYLFTVDNCHFPIGNGFLSMGLQGILEKTRNRADYDTDETAEYRAGIHEVYKNIEKFIIKHMKVAEKMAEIATAYDEIERLNKIADTCRAIVTGKPESFVQALQLFFFIYILRSPFGAGCIGRLDQKLYPFYEMEVHKKTWNRNQALSLICEFYQRLNEMSTGDTLRNLMLSGQDKNGKDVTNELTYLFLEAYTIVGGAEPHLNVRIHKNTPKKLIDKSIQILSLGKGQPTLYFDEPIIQAMCDAGISLEDACEYANDGCTETVIDGKSAISFWQHDMVKSVELTLFNGMENPFIYPVEMTKSARGIFKFTPKTESVLGYQSGELVKMQTFEDFLNAYFRQEKWQIERWLRVIDQKIEDDMENTMTSLLIAGTFEKCVETGKDPLRGGGFSIANYQLLAGTVSTAADCLRAIEYCVFEKKYCSLIQIRDACARDFEGFEELRFRLLNAPKYGNGEARVDELGALIANHFLKTVREFKTQGGNIIWPGLYNIDFKIHANCIGATPDGRKFKDPIGEHCSPTPGAAVKGPTAIIESASRLPMKKGFASSPLHLTLDQSSFVMGAVKEKVIEQLIKAVQSAEIPVLNLSMYYKDQLVDAKKNPEKYKDLIVRVWGFNARFVDLDDELQDHIIKRIC